MCERCASECENIHKWSIAKNVGRPVVNVQKCAMNMIWRIESSKFNFMKATHQH
jgi:hypothetical protein